MVWVNQARTFLDRRKACGGFYVRGDECRCRANAFKRLPGIIPLPVLVRRSGILFEPIPELWVRAQRIEMLAHGEQFPRLASRVCGVAHRVRQS